jgi:hypothetical protein
VCGATGNGKRNLAAPLTGRSPLPNPSVIGLLCVVVEGSAQQSSKMSGGEDMASLTPERWKRMYPVYTRSPRGPYFLPEERASYSKMQVCSCVAFFPLRVVRVAPVGPISCCERDSGGRRHRLASRSPRVPSCGLHSLGLGRRCLRTTSRCIGSMYG